MKSRFTKLFCFGMIFVLLGVLASCNIFKNSYKTLENGAIITVPDELKEYFKYPNNIPSMYFGYENINVAKSSTSAHLVFVQNDFYKISDAWGNHINSYDEGEFIITYEYAQTNETVSARLGKELLPLDEYDENGNLQKTSMEYKAVGFGEDGTRYSYIYRTYVSGGKRYYSYAFTDNLTITMELSLMVIKGDKTNQLLLITLPFDTKYEVSGATLSLHALTEKDTYLDAKYYTFAYPEYLKEYSNEEQVEMIVKWYEKHCQGEYVDDEFYFNYAGARFKIDFDQSKETSSKETVRAFRLIYQGDSTKA